MSSNLSKVARMAICFGIAALLILAPGVIDPSKAVAAPGQKKLIEGAKKEGKILFYTTMTTEDSSRLLNRFKENYPFLETKLIRSSGTKMITKILSDAKANIHPDAVLADGFGIHFLKTKGLLQKYLSPERKAYAKGFKDQDGYYTSGYTSTNVIAYNTNLVSPNEAPKTYEDLLDPKWKGKMGMDSDDIEWFANMLKIMGREKGRKFMIKLSAQDPRLRKGHTLNTLLLAAGEFPIAVNVFGHRVEKMKAKGAPIEWVATKRTITRLNPVGVAAHAAHPNAAKLFVNFVLSKKGQMIIRDFRRIPSRSDVEPNPPRLIRGLKLVPSDLTLSENLNKHVKKFEDIFLKMKWRRKQLKKTKKWG